MTCLLCEHPVYARGLCWKHWQHHYRHGTLEAVALPPGKRGPRPGTKGRTRAKSDEHPEPDEPGEYERAEIEARLARVRAERERAR